MFSHTRTVVQDMSQVCKNRPTPHSRASRLATCAFARLEGNVLIRAVPERCAFLPDHGKSSKRVTAMAGGDASIEDDCCMWKEETCGEQGEVMK